MGIEALSVSTVRTIGATQVLNDPASVIKELIDNALDAQSTSISIEIHSNTLDSIQVRDNGHGIPPEDRQLVAKPHCTSKISGEDDLKAIAGIYLGFRGEALASVAEMSGSLTISTRVEGEEVATVLKVNQRGDVVKQDRASLPVGTTVKITDFIKTHPVRRQVALKGAEKTLGKIKQTLKAYAFARPYVRLSLRVVKGKNDKSNWTYAPKADGNAEDAAFKIVGAACATQCTWSVMEQDGFTLQGFLPKANARVGICSNIGSFLSIDARPVSTARGLPKQILKLFRDTLKKANPDAEGVKEPFLFLEIQCPSASYDANIEPAKDDVLFEDPDKVIGLARQLFEAVYPSLEKHVTAVLVEGDVELPRQRTPDRLNDNDCVTSPALTAIGNSNFPLTPWTPLPTKRSSPSLDEGNIESGVEAQPLRIFRSNMYGRDEEDLQIADDRPRTSHVEADFEELRHASRDVNTSNPWILAKINTRVRQPEPDADDEPAAFRINAHHVRKDDRAGITNCEEEASALPTPRSSSPLKSIDTPRALTDVPNARSAGDSRLIGAHGLPPPGPTILAPQIRYQLDDPPAQRRQQPVYNYDVSLDERDNATDTPLRNIANSSPRRHQGLKKPTQPSQVNASSKSPLKDQSPREQVWFDHLENMDRNRSSKRQHLPRESNGTVVQGELGDLLDDARALTPPRRNRDMRDFLTTRRIGTDDMSAERDETRHTLTPRQAQTGARQDARQSINDKNNDGLAASIHDRGFKNASELTVEGSRFGPLLLDTSRPSKRRKTSERRALEEISGNAEVRDGDFDERNQAVAGSEGTTNRRHASDSSPGKSRRRKSSRLPLERVPKGQRMHNLVYESSQGMRKVSIMAVNVDQKRSMDRWNEAAINSADIFATVLDTEAEEEITTKLHELLGKHISDGQMAQDLGVVLHVALAAHSQAAMEVEM